jgi:hypothetical protein
MSTIFIDESGTNKNSGFSTIAAVKISREDIHELNGNIVRVESLIGIDLFHWSRHKWPVRHRFLYEIIHTCHSLNLSIDVVIRQNPLKSNIFLEQAIKIIAREKTAEKIIIDGEKSHAYERRIKRILHENGLRIHLPSISRDETVPAVRSRELFQFLINTFEVKIHLS